MTGAIILGILGLILGFAQWKVNSDDQWLANEQAKKFNKDEAEKSRQWQEEQYKKYESVAAQMQQRQQAGLNPYDGITSMSVGSGSTASTSANQISPLSLPDTSLFSQLAQGFESAEAQSIENDFNRDTFDKRKEQFDEQVELLRLDNEQKRYVNELFKDAYYDENGNIDNNPYSYEVFKKQQEARKAWYEANSAEFAQEIKENEKTQSDYKQWLKSMFNIDIESLPQYMQNRVVQYTYHLMNKSAWSNEDYHNFNQVKDQINTWIDEEAEKHRHESSNTTSTFRDLEELWSIVEEYGPFATVALQDFWSGVKGKFFMEGAGKLWSNVFHGQSNNVFE